MKLYDWDHGFRVSVKCFLFILQGLSCVLFWFTLPVFVFFLLSCVSLVNQSLFIRSVFVPLVLHSPRQFSPALVLMFVLLASCIWVTTPSASCWGILLKKSMSSVTNVSNLRFLILGYKQQTWLEMQEENSTVMVRMNLSYWRSFPSSECRQFTLVLRHCPSSAPLSPDWERDLQGTNLYADGLISTAITLQSAFELVVKTQHMQWNWQNWSDRSSVRLQPSQITR